MTKQRVDGMAVTEYGFRWGPMEITRMASFPRGDDVCRVVGLYVGEGDDRKQKLEVYVSPTGKSVRVWRDGKELS